MPMRASGGYGAAIGGIAAAGGTAATLGWEADGDNEECLSEKQTVIGVGKETSQARFYAARNGGHRERRRLRLPGTPAAGVRFPGRIQLSQEKLFSRPVDPSCRLVARPPDPPFPTGMREDVGGGGP